MGKQITFEIDEDIHDEVNKILDDVGLDIQGIINVCFKRIIKENSVSFLLSNKSTSERNTNYYAESKMSKSKAMRLFSSKGIKINRDVTFASKNNNAYNYWANPNFEVLNYDWNLMLNDWINKTIYLFQIPKSTFSISDFKPRADRSELIDLQIMYNDPTFTDNRSGISFLKFLVDEINY